MIINQKKEIRQKILTLLRNQKEEERAFKSSIICNKLIISSEFKRAQTVLFYSALPEEVDTFEMIKQALKLGKKAGLPSIISGENDFSPPDSRSELLDDTLNDFFSEFKYGIGVGLQYQLPVGPIRFDIAYNPDPEEIWNEESWVYHFSLGMAFWKSELKWLNWAKVTKVRSELKWAKVPKVESELKCLKLKVN